MDDTLRRIRAENGIIRIGKMGEIPPAIVEIPIGKIQWGAGRVEIKFHRAEDTGAYLAEHVEIDGSNALWYLSEADLCRKGAGEAQVVWYAEDGHRLKSDIYRVIVDRALEYDAGEPDVWTGVCDRVAGYAGQAERAAESADTSAKSAQAFAADAAGSAGQASEECARAGQAAQEADQAAVAAAEKARLAEAAAEQAGQAAQAAEQSKAEAENAGTAAENAKTAAQTATEHAETAERSAAASLRRMEEQAGTAAEKLNEAAEAVRKNAEVAEKAAADAGKSAEKAIAAQLSAENAKTDAAESAKGAKDAMAGAEKAAAQANANAEAVAAGQAAQDQKIEALEKAGINDGCISAETPWSSKKIIDMLCPALEETGNPVTCYPVAGYPLGVVASWEPTQAGSGEPSPDNIRPISGRDAVSVERCGRNLIKPIWKSKSESGISYIVNDDYSITIRGTATARSYIKFFDSKFGESLVDGTYTLCTLTNLPAGTSILAGHYDGTVYVGNIAGISPGKNHVTFAAKGVHSLDAYIDVKAGATVDTTVYLMLVPGSTPPTEYTPYRGDTLDLALPSTVYGGTVDAVTGEGAETWKLVTLDGTENWETWGVNKHNAAVTGFYTYSINDFAPNGNKLLCSTMPYKNVDVWGGRNEGIGYASALTQGSRYIIYSVKTDTLSDASDDASAVASFKAFLAAQYAAGTPVQIAYKLAEPVPFQATGNGPIMPLEGETNTIMTDADSVAVTGRADPIRIIQQLQAAQSAAAAQLDETQQAVVDTTAMAVDYIYEQDSKIFGGEDNDNETDTAATDVP